MQQFKRDCLINHELSEAQKYEFFAVKEKKFLHNIDTFYYSVTFTNDFSKDSEDCNVERLRSFFGSLSIQLQDFEDCIPVFIPGINNLLYRPFSFSRYYRYCLEVPEEFDIFIAQYVPTDKTSQMIVQLRSNCLWLSGIYKAFEDSLDVVNKIAAYFKLQIMEIKENRIDYCWHTNSIQSPEKFFRPDKFAQMEVSRYDGGLFRYRFVKNVANDIESDYIALGTRGGNCFVRIYLKSKEVIEMGYKPYFLKLWQLNGMISRFDFYVYDKCFLTGNWLDVDRFRLQFYKEYGSSIYHKQQIDKLLLAERPNYPAMKDLADVLVPPVTLVINIEYQTSRKSSKSYKLINIKDNSKYGVSSRIYDYLDNWRLITNYLTHDTLRLVDFHNADTNKSRLPYCDFWKRLRSTKPFEKLSKTSGKIVREYNRELNTEVVKRRMCNSIVTYSIYCKGKNDDSVFDDVMGSILRLNDNDIERMKHYKSKKLLQFNDNDLSKTADNRDISGFSIIDTNTGEFYDYYKK